MHHMHQFPARLAAPAMALLSFVFIAPFIYMVFISFHDYDLTGPTDLLGRFAYLKNFETIIIDPYSREALALTVLYAFVCVSAELLLGLVLAFILTHHSKNVTRFASLIIIPSALSPASVGLMWLFLLHTEHGPVWTVLRPIFPQSHGLLGEPALALPTLMAIDVWQWTPMLTVILYAGLLRVPRGALDAARVDGAGTLHLLKISVSYVKLLLASVAALRFLDAFREFDKILVTTGGGPGTATETVAIYLWRLAFKYWKLGPASALSLAIYVVLLSLGVLIARRVRPTAQ